jgi:hypothetical protein
VLILIWFLSSAITWAVPTLPVVVALKGDVQILSKTGTDLPSMTYEGERFYYRKAKIGLQLEEGAIVLCSNEARAKLVYPSGTSLWLGQGTMVKIIKAEEAPVGENSVLNLMYGRVRALVTKSKDAKWEIRKPSAVDGVRGTDFVSSYSPVTGSEVTVISGVVEVKPTAPSTRKQEVKPDETSREVSAGNFKVEPIHKVQVLSAYELTVIPPEKAPEAKVAELETKSRALVVEELSTSQPQVYKAIANPAAISDQDLNRKVIEKHLQQAKGQAGVQEPFTHDLDSYKKLDEGK